jgi:hypothetical protein
MESEQLTDGNARQNRGEDRQLVPRLSQWVGEETQAEGDRDQDGEETEPSHEALLHPDRHAMADEQSEAGAQQNCDDVQDRAAQEHGRIVDGGERHARPQRSVRRVDSTQPIGASVGRRPWVRRARGLVHDRHSVSADESWPAAGRAS